MNLSQRVIIMIQYLQKMYYLTHTFTYPKAVHSYKYFIQPMHTPNSFPPRRSKIIFVFQVTFSNFFGSVGREKKFFCEKSLFYRFHTIE